MFLEEQFPKSISFGTEISPEFLTDMVMVGASKKVRNANRSEPIRVFDLAHAVRTQAQYDAFDAFFYTTAQGRLNSFRFQNPADYGVPSTRGRLAATGQSGTFTAAAIGNGTPTYQLALRSTSGGQTKDREIRKPSLTVGINTIYRNAAPVTFGGAPGNCALNTANGIVTFIADDSEAIASHTPGTSHVFTTTADIPGLAIGEKVYLTGVTGTAAATLNSIAHAISNKTGAGPYTWTLSTNTSGLTASVGTAFEYPQATDALTWAGEFDVPVEFGIDAYKAQITEKQPGGGLLYRIDSIPMMEVRIGDGGQEL